MGTIGCLISGHKWVVQKQYSPGRRQDDAREKKGRLSTWEQCEGCGLTKNHRAVEVTFHPEWDHI